MPSGNKYKLEDKNWIDLHDEQIVEIESGGRMKILFTPGHADDHVCILLDNEVLFSGDNILGGSTAVFDNYFSYMKSLDRMKNAIAKVGNAIIYPGHGDIIEDGLDRIEYYIAHRLEREKQILQNLGNL